MTETQTVTESATFEGGVSKAGECLLPLSQLFESALNTRRRFDAAELENLADSIAAQGLVQPLLVRPAARPGAFEILAGARRYRAFEILAGRTGGKGSAPVVVPCRVWPCDETQALELMAVENEQREDLHPLEAAKGYQQLHVLGKYSIEDVSRKVGKKVPYVLRRMNLLKLIPDAQTRFLEDKNFTLGHAEAIAPLQESDQARVLKSWIQDCGEADKYRGRDIPSAQGLRQFITSNILLSLDKPPFPILDAGLVAKAGACPDCPKRTGAAPALFPDITKGDHCLDGKCFEQKTKAFVKQRAGALKAEGKSLVKVTKSYYADKKHPDVLTSSKFKDIGKEAKCKFAEEAVYADGNNDGVLTVICRSIECAKHHQRESGHSTVKRPPTEMLAEKKKELAAAIERFYPRRLAREVRSKVIAKKSDTVPELDLRMIAHTIFDGFGGEERKECARDILCFESVKERQDSFPDWDTPVHKAIEKWNPAELLGFIMALAGEHFKSRHSMIERWRDPEKKGQPTILEQLATRYKIDPKAIRAVVTQDKGQEWAKRMKHLEKRIANEKERANPKPAKVAKTKTTPAEKAGKSRVADALNKRGGARKGKGQVAHDARIAAFKAAVDLPKVGAVPKLSAALTKLRARRLEILSSAPPLLNGKANKTGEEVVVTH